MSDLRESGCLTADTKVLRADTGAETTLGELHAAGARDVPVWSLDDSLRYVRRHLTHVFPTGIKPVFRVTLVVRQECASDGQPPVPDLRGLVPARAAAHRFAGRRAAARAGAGADDRRGTTPR